MQTVFRPEQRLSFAVLCIHMSTNTCATYARKYQREKRWENKYTTTTQWTNNPTLLFTYTQTISTAFFPLKVNSNTKKSNECNSSSEFWFIWKPVLFVDFEDYHAFQPDSTQNIPNFTQSKEKMNSLHRKYSTQLVSPTVGWNDSSDDSLYSIHTGEELLTISMHRHIVDSFVTYLRCFDSFDSYLLNGILNSH